MIGAPGAPSAKTSWVAVALRPQPSKRSSAARSASSVSADAAISRAERAASSGGATATGARLSGARDAGSASTREGSVATRRGCGAALSAKRSCGVSSSARSTPASLHQRRTSAAAAGVRARVFCGGSMGKETGSWPEAAGASSMSRRPGRRGSTLPRDPRNEDAIDPAGAAAAGPLHECEHGGNRGAPRPRVDGLRCRDRRRRAGRTGRGDPPEAARRRPLASSSSKRARRSAPISCPARSSTRSASTGSLPGWRDDPEQPLKTAVTADRFYFSAPRRRCACRTGRCRR